MEIKLNSKEMFIISKLKNTPSTLSGISLLTSFYDEMIKDDVFEKIIELDNSIQNKATNIREVVEKEKLETDAFNIRLNELCELYDIGDTANKFMTLLSSNQEMVFNISEKTLLTIKECFESNENVSKLGIGDFLKPALSGLYRKIVSKIK